MVYVQNKDGKPLIYWTTETQDGLELLGNLQHDPNNPSDVAAGDDHCLAGDTLIKTDRGDLPISSLVGTSGRVLNHLGDWVPYWNCKSYGEEELIRLEFADGACLECTPDHRIMDAKGEWVMACDFLDTVRLAGSGAEPRCVKIHSLPRSEVFCLNTPAPHSFYTAGGIVVHNCPDSTRYMAMARPFVRSKPASELTQEQKFRKPTMDEVWQMMEAQNSSRR